MSVPKKKNSMRSQFEQQFTCGKTRTGKTCWCAHGKDNPLPYHDLKRSLRGVASGSRSCYIGRPARVVGDPPRTPLRAQSEATGYIGARLETGIVNRTALYGGYLGGSRYPHVFSSINTIPKFYEVQKGESIDLPISRIQKKILVGSIQLRALTIQLKPNVQKPRPWNAVLLWQNP